MRARVAVLIMRLESLLGMAILDLVLEPEVVLHHCTGVLRTCAVQVATVLFKLELKGDRDLSPSG